MVFINKNCKKRHEGAVWTAKSRIPEDGIMTPEMCIILATEKTTVKDAVTGEFLCRAVSEEEAQWIAKQLNSLTVLRASVVKFIGAETPEALDFMDTFYKTAELPEAVRNILVGLVAALKITS